MGIVEVSRGCGLGCDFCTMAGAPMRHLPPETVVSDVETNVAAGVDSVSLISEDIFRYGAAGVEGVRPEALKDLLRRVREVNGLRLIQTDHANIATISRFSDEDLCEVRRLMAGGARHEFVWVNLGVESASGELLEANGGGPKMRPFGAEEWGDACREQVRRLAKAGFFPLVSLLIGLPGETEAHVRRSIEWVAQIGGERAAVFPMFFAPIEGSAGRFAASDMTGLHWRLFELSYTLNFRWIPKLFWDNQTGAGTPFWKRALLQALGRAQVVMWKRRFARHSDRRAP